MKYITFILLGLIFQLHTDAQLKDTVLNMVLSKPYFYNIVQGKDGKIFAGTSEGIFKIEKFKLRQNGSHKGYLTIDYNGNPIIDSNGIRYYKEKKFLNLLPFPKLARDEYHAEKDNIFYICSGGRLYIYDIVPFEYSYQEHSIRSISPNLVGTYSGVYLHGKKLGLPAPDFVDGNIREFGNRAFLCNYDLFIMEKDAILSDTIIPEVNCFNFNLPNSDFINDIYPTPDGKNYYIATQNSLIYTDYNFKKDSTIYTHNFKDQPITLIENLPNRLYFTSSNELLRLEFKTRKYISVLKLSKPILAGIFTDFQFYIITSDALYRYNSGHQIEKLTDLVKAHSLINISGSELVISSDLGLYLFNIASRTLSPIINGIEFNRRALFKNNDTIYAGSVNGLYKIQVNAIPTLIKNNKSGYENTGTPIIIIIIFTLLILSTALSIILIKRYRAKLKTAEKIIVTLSSPEVTVTREKIYDYIQNNLATASIKTITNEFKINAPQIYEILKPDKPGTIIQEIRFAMVKKMREEGKSHEEIAKASGLSISYLRKLKTT